MIWTISIIGFCCLIFKSIDMCLDQWNYIKYISLNSFDMIFSLSCFKTKLIHSYGQGNRVNSPPAPSVKSLCWIPLRLVISFSFYPPSPQFNGLDNFLSLYCLVDSHFLFSWSWYIVFLSFKYLGKIIWSLNTFTLEVQYFLIVFI